MLQETVTEFYINSMNDPKLQKMLVVTNGNPSDSSLCGLPPYLTSYPNVDVDLIILLVNENNEFSERDNKQKLKNNFFFFALFCLVFGYILHAKHKMKHKKKLKYKHI